MRNFFDDLFGDPMDELKRALDSAYVPKDESGNEFLYSDTESVKRNEVMDNDVRS